MDYGFTLKQAIEQVEYDLHYFNGEGYINLGSEAEVRAAMEVITDNGSAPISAKNEQKKETKPQSISEMARKSATTDKANDKLAKEQNKDPKSLQADFDEKMKIITDRAEAVRVKMSNLVQVTIDGNKEFMSDIGNYKLLPGVTVVNWSYNHEPMRYLHGKVIQLKSVIEHNIGYLTEMRDPPPRDCVLQCKMQEIEETLLRSIGAPSSATRYSQFVTWTQTQFRGPKRERQLKGSDAQKYLQEMKIYEDAGKKLTQDLREVENAVKRITAIIRPKIRDPKAAYNDIAQYLQKVDRLGKMFTIYTGYTQLTYRLYTEYILNRRAALKRLYQK